MPKENDAREWTDEENLIFMKEYLRYSYGLAYHDELDEMLDGIAYKLPGVSGDDLATKLEEINELFGFMQTYIRARNELEKEVQTALRRIREDREEEK